MTAINKNSAFFIFILASAIVLFLIAFLQPAGNDASDSEPSNASEIMPMPSIDGPNPKDAKGCNGQGEENTREYSHMFIFGRKDGDKSQAANAVLLKGEDNLIPALFADHIEMPIPACPSAAFMNGVDNILIDFVDQQVLDFLAQISPAITDNNVELHIGFHVDEQHWYMDERKREAVAQLVQTFLAAGSAQIRLYSTLVNTIFLPPTMDFGMEAIYLSINAKAEIQQLLKILSTDRRDGKQHVVCLEIYNPTLISYILDAIKKDFHASTTKLPQPYYILFLPVAGRNNLIKPPQSQEQNPQTDEILSLMHVAAPEPFAHHTHFYVRRYPASAGDGEQKVKAWAEDGKKRLEYHWGRQERRKIYLQLTILEFGMPFTTEKENMENPSPKRPYDFKRD